MNCDAMLVADGHCGATALYRLLSTSSRRFACSDERHLGEVVTRLMLTDPQGYVTVTRARVVVETHAPDESYRRGRHDALREAAEALYDGAGDTEQELYDHGAAAWLEARAAAQVR